MHLEPTIRNPQGNLSPTAIAEGISEVRNFCCLSTVRAPGIQKRECDGLNSFPVRLFASRETISESIPRRYAAEAERKVLEEIYIMGLFLEQKWIA